MYAGNMSKGISAIPAERKELRISVRLTSTDLLEYSGQRKIIILHHATVPVEQSDNFILSSYLKGKECL